MTVPGAHPSAETRLFLVGGIPVEARGAAEALRVLEERFGVVPTSEPPEVRVDLCWLPELPTSDPVVEVDRVGLWWERDTIWFSTGTTGGRLARGTLEVGAGSANPMDPGAIDRICQFGIGAAVATPDRAMLHAAALVRRDRTVMVIGKSGRGKSTLAAAALASGWLLLGDDLAVIRTGEHVTIEGVRRSPLFPKEVVSDMPEATEARRIKGDRRARWSLPVEVLSAGARPLDGVIVAGHDDGQGLIEPIPPEDLVPTVLEAMAVPLIPPVMRSHLAVLTRLTALPVIRLRHAADPGARRQRAAQLLDEAAAAI